MAFNELVTGDSYIADNKRELKIIKSTDHLVATVSGGCVYGHMGSPVLAKVSVRSMLGKIQIKTVRAVYCDFCDSYYLSQSEWEKLKSFGTPICKTEVKKIEEITKLKQHSFREILKYYVEHGDVPDFMIPEYESDSNSKTYEGKYILREESDLRRMGYSTNQEDDLSDEERQCILLMALKNGAYRNKSHLIYKLEKDLNRAKNKKGMELSVAKLKRDIEYLKNLKKI